MLHATVISRRALTAALTLTLILAAPVLASAQADAPSATISNGTVNAKLWLPDADKGYYRASRFDWSGAIASLTANGHEYFGQWFANYDPMAHGNITGPVEDYWPVNYEAAKPGETFVKIGVGTLKKADDTPYRFQAAYERLDTGKWTTTKGANWIEFKHELTDPASGYGYVYTKRVALTPGQSQMTIDHSLQNTGTKAIDTDNYNHGFFMLDRQPTGPDTRVTFTFDPKPERDLGAGAAIRGKQLVYLQELITNPPLPPGATRPPPAPGAPPTVVQSVLTGHSLTDVKDFDIKVENTRTGAGVRFYGDTPMIKMNYWSTRSNVSPEAYVAVKAAPGATTTWRITYDFYSLPAGQRTAGL